VRIHGVAADVPFTVSLVDAFGAAHAAQQVVLGKGEARSLAVRLDAPARKVTVAVRDASGSPVEGAEVVGWVGERWMRVAWATTAADGSFVLDGARTREVRILVLAKGFVPRAIAAATDRNHEIRLERGRRVRFRVTDAAGAPVGDAEVRVVCDGFLPEDFPCDPWVAAEVEQGLYEIDGLPGGEVTVSVRTREHAERFRHDTRKPEGELVLGSD